jgi:hypothetical protein
MTVLTMPVQPRQDSQSYGHSGLVPEALTL